MNRNRPARVQAATTSNSYYVELESVCASRPFCRADAQLEDYARQKVNADKRGRKSAILPHGTLAFRTVPASVKISGTAAALDAAKQFRMPDMVRTVETLDTARYQKAAQQAFQQQGCVLPGVEVTPARSSFSIKFGKVEDE